MNIIVCLKQVPGTTEVKIDPKTNTLIRQGIQSIVNPFDSYALEEGVRLKEHHGGKVTAISMGPPQAADMLRDAISVGADEAFLLSDMAFAGSDTLATAATLGKAAEKIKTYDLIICGRQTIDGDTGQVGPELAENLGIPFIAYVSKIEEITNGKMRVQRAVEDGYETIESPLPAVITVAKEINVPRMPSLRGLLTYANHDISEMYQLQGLPQAQIDQIQKSGLLAGNRMTWLMSFSMLPFLGYLLFIKKFLRGK